MAHIYALQYYPTYYIFSVFNRAGIYTCNTNFGERLWCELYLAEIDFQNVTYSVCSVDCAFLYMYLHVSSYMYIYAQTYMCISMTLSDCLIERKLLSLIKTQHELHMALFLNLVLFLFFTPAVRFSFFFL